MNTKYLITFLMGCSMYLSAASTNVSDQARGNQLRKIFHHKAFGSQVAHLELGNLVLYFDKEPAVQSLAKKQTAQEEKRVLLLPAIRVVDAEMRALIEGVNRSGGPYTLEIKEVSKPNQGLQISISFNPAKIGMSYEKFESIGLQKGLVFRFYNKELLDKIELSSKPILQTAYRSSVVIDCGHGGIDIGAIGCNSVYEKDICLPVGIEVARVLQDKGIMTHLARSNDRTVVLDERTTFANQCQADLFVSIHANTSPNKTASGIETFFVTPDLFCAVESNKKLCACLNRKYAQSKQLADCVHTSLIGTMRTNYPVKDRLVRSAASNVLIGTVMPSVLVEIGFLSHEKEAALLAQSAYQKQVAQGIAHGILDYLKQNPALA